MVMDYELIRMWEQLIFYFVIIFQHSYTETLENCGKTSVRRVTLVDRIFIFMCDLAWKYINACGL
jgi:hypothetical protein